MALSDFENWGNDESIARDRYLLRERRLRDATKAERQKALAQRSKYAQNHEKTVILPPLSPRLQDGEENTGGALRALKLRPAVKHLHNSRPTEEPDSQLSTLPLTETQSGQEIKAFEEVQVHEERQNSGRTRVELPQYDTTPRAGGEISFKVLCAQSLRSPLPDVQLNIIIHPALQYPTSFVLSDLRDQPHEYLGVHETTTHEKSTFDCSGPKVTKVLAVRTLKPSQDGLSITRMGIVKDHRVSRRSTKLPHCVTVRGYVVAFNNLVNGLLERYTQGEWAKEKMKYVGDSLVHQAMTYLVLSDLGISGINANETLLYLTNGGLSSQIHQEIVPLLDVAAAREPFDSWIMGFDNPRPIELEARVQVLYWFMNICRKTLEKLRMQQSAEQDITHRKSRQHLDCLLSVGHDNLRMQARSYQASLPYPEVHDGFVPPPKGKLMGGEARG